MSELERRGLTEVVEDQDAKPSLTCCQKVGKYAIKGSLINKFNTCRNLYMQNFSISINCKVCLATGLLLLLLISGYFLIDEFNTAPFIQRRVVTQGTNNIA